MREIQPGIFSEEKDIVKLADKPLVLVHPFFCRYCADYFCVEDGSGGSYLSNLDNLVKDSKDRNIFVFETQNAMKNTIQKVSDSSGLDGKYFITTLGRENYAEATPRFSSWEPVRSFLSNFGDDFLFAGGFVGFGPFHDELAGCLGDAYHSLKTRKLNGQFVLASCYSSERYRPMFFNGNRDTLVKNLRQKLIGEKDRKISPPYQARSQEEYNEHLSKVLKPWLEIGKL